MAKMAKEMSDDYKRQQAELVAGHIAKQDIVITTALIPGRKAPVLVNADMVASMKPGSVLVDLAVEQGGNVEGAELDKYRDAAGVGVFRLSVGLENSEDLITDLGRVLD